MKKYLITGCAGFIGSNFVYYMLKKYDDILLANLDKLTYAGNLENLKGVEGDPRHVFVQGDICDKALVAGLFEKYDFDYVINFAAESHVDRSIANPEYKRENERILPWWVVSHLALLFIVLKLDLWGAPHQGGLCLYSSWNSHQCLVLHCAPRFFMD